MIQWAPKFSYNFPRFLFIVQIFIQFFTQLELLLVIPMLYPSIINLFLQFIFITTPSCLINFQSFY